MHIRFCFAVTFSERANALFNMENVTPSQCINKIIDLEKTRAFNYRKGSNAIEKRKPGIRKTTRNNDMLI